MINQSNNMTHVLLVNWGPGDSKKVNKTLYILINSKCNRNVYCFNNFTTRMILSGIGSNAIKYALISSAHHAPGG